MVHLPLGDLTSQKWLLPLRVDIRYYFQWKIILNYTIQKMMFAIWEIEKSAVSFSETQNANIIFPHHVTASFP